MAHLISDAATCVRGDVPIYIRWKIWSPFTEAAVESKYWKVEENDIEKRYKILHEIVPISD